MVEKAQEMLVDEVEPEKATNGALIRIADRSQNVPRRTNHQKHERAGKQAATQQMAQIPGQNQINPYRP
jgi:hypothetical protein